VVKGFGINVLFILFRSLITITVFCLSVSAKAQLCNGSLGDPVVDINFGNSSNGNAGYTPTNAYTYTSSTCPDDGYYTITKNTSGCFGNRWHTINSDHTGNGAFMLVNASYEPGDFFVTTVTNLCPNTNYQFSAWLMNVLNFTGIRPNITFNVEADDGTVLGTYSTGDIPETGGPTWKEYGFYFLTPADNASIVLRMTNNAPGGNGNDIALDDITFRPCGPVITAAIKDNSDTVNVCEGNSNSYTLTADVSAEYVSPLYQWQASSDGAKTWQNIDGATSLLYQRLPSAAGNYLYRLTVIEQKSAAIISCRIASNNVAINVHKNPLVDAGPGRILIAGTPVTLEASVTGEDPAYYWNPSAYLNDNTLLTPVASPPADMAYTLLATTPYGCANKDETTVKVVAGIFVPNAFTPNGDGKNDHWRIPFLDPLLNAKVNVYNRYGQVVYSTTGQTIDWDGTLNSFPQPSGTYIYNIRFSKDYPDMKGTLLLIR
jgi:gliding motility-associated-like protein